MAIKALNHYTLISDDLAANKLFYADIVGLALLMPRDKGVTQNIDFAFPGQHYPVVSIIDNHQPLKSQNVQREHGFQLHGQVNPAGKNCFATGPFEHICFSYDATDYERVKQQLNQHHFDCREGFDFMPKCKQIWTLDPNGGKVEFQFDY